MKKTTYLIACLLMCAAARAGFCANNAGTATASFLKLPVDARSVGMGDAVAAGARGAMALFQNPAGLADSSTEISFSHAMLVEDISYDVLGAAVPIGEKGVIGAGAQSLKYGSFDSLYNNGDSAGSLSPKDTAFALGWGMALNEDIMAGAALKRIDSKISGSASTSALDLGLLISGEELSVGFAAQNMGKGLKFNKESSPLPVNVKLGLYIPFSEKWQCALDFNFPKDGPVWAGAGAEYAFIQKGSWTLLGRAGYNTAANDTDGVNGISAGFGLKGKNLAFDYAFKTMGLLGSTHHLGLTCRLGK